jgi:hypothetical protein
MQDHDLDGFAPYSDAEIANIAAFLHEQRNMACPITPDGHVNEEEEEDSNWDDSDDVAMSDTRLIPPLTELCLDDLPDDILDGFTALQATDELGSLGKSSRSSRHSMSAQ